MTRKENNTENKILSCLESSGGIQFQENSIFFSSPISLPCLLETLEEGCWDPKNSSNVWNLRVLSSCLRKGRRGNPTERPCAYERAVSETTLVLNEVANSVYLGGKVYKGIHSEGPKLCFPTAENLGLNTKLGTRRNWWWNTVLPQILRVWSARLCYKEWPHSSIFKRKHFASISLSKQV